MTGHAATDITLQGMGGSPYATEEFAGSIPMDRIRELFSGEVGFTPIYTMHDNVLTKVPNRHALVKDNGDTLNVVSKRYAIHQFGEVLVDNLLTLLSASDGEVDVLGAGLLSNGAVGWVQVKAPTINVHGDDIAPTVTLASSHNGTLATSYRIGLYRFMCSNQIGALRSSRGKRVYKLRHTTYSHMQFGAARAALGVMFAESEQFAREVDELISTKITDGQFWQMVKALNPKPSQSGSEPVSPGAVTRWENRVDTLAEMYRNDDRVKAYTGTAWGALQTFSTYNQWERPFRSVGANGDATRAGRTMSDYLSGRTEDTDVRFADIVRQVAFA